MTDLATPYGTDEVIIYTDGGSRGNPGPAAAGFILIDNRANQLVGRGIFLGRSTNNLAEYTAVIRALEAAKQAGAEKVEVFSDSQLLVEQLNGRYKVKSEQIRPLFRQAAEMLNQFKQWKVSLVARDQNKGADKLVNQALNLEQDVEAEPTSSKTPDSKFKTQNLKCCQASAVRHPQADPNGLRLGVLISGGGTTLMNILKYIQQGRLNAQVAVVISSLSTAAGVEKAKSASLNVKIVRKKDYPDVDEFSKHIEAKLASAKVGLVVQGGWLCLWKIPQRYENRVMNIHPALLPSFGGKGMWGHYVHEAVLAAGCKVSGCTVHFCTNEYDKGPIIVQRTCEVKDDDTPETLAARVFEQECIAYPQAIKLFAEGKILVQNGRVRIKS